MDYKLHTAVGLQDVFPDDYAYKNRIKAKITNVFEKYAYLPISSPTLEYVEVFEEKEQKGKAFKIIDRDGSVLALRTDMTPPIARIVSTAYSENNIPFRFYYLENSFRYNENLQGKSREFTQAGVELIGIDSAEADCEIIIIAINSLLNAGLDEFKISLGHVDFINGILEELNFDERTLSEIQENIIKKDFISIKKLTDNEILNNLQYLMDGVEILNKYVSIENEKSRKTILRLLEIYEKIKDFGFEKYISFDLSMVGNFSYYTGIIFSAYTFGIGFSILDGGRYDNLLNYFGLDLPAVGLAVKINDLSDAMKYQKIDLDLNFAETLIVYNDETRINAHNIANELRAQGLIIENSLFGMDLQKNIDYAKSKNIQGILVFENDKIRALDLINNTNSEISIDELLNGGN